MDRTWRQFRVAMRECFQVIVPHYASDASRALIIRHALHTRPIPGWQWESTLAAEDVGCGDLVAADSLQPPESPTDAMPGTTRKLNVLAARAAAGEALWHPEDASEFGPLD